VENNVEVTDIKIFLILNVRLTLLYQNYSYITNVTLDSQVRHF